LSGIEGESGSNPSWGKDLRSSSLSKAEPTDPFLIFLVEDNPADAFLVREAIAMHKVLTRLVVIRDGEEAIRLIDKADTDPTAPCPVLFLLDLNIPTKNGEEVLAHIRKSKRCVGTPVVIVTSSDSPADRAAVELLGANRYFRKPTDLEDFMQIGEVIKEMLGLE
jgi:CheY-like chemotaxis protein